VEFHPFSAEEESELGYMDDPYHEESYEDLLTPSFFSLERDTLQIVEVTQKSSLRLQDMDKNNDVVLIILINICHDMKCKTTNSQINFCQISHHSK